MVMVAFAILKDEIPVFYETLLGTLFGIPFLIFMNCMLFWLYLKTTRQYKRITKDNGKAGKEYEWVDTWYTKQQSKPSNGEPSGRDVYNFCFWGFTLIANTLIISFVIF